MARSNTRDNLTVSDRPFARVLTAFMWSKQPPWSATRLARELGMGRARVVNWIYHNTDPDLATMLSVMAQLNIPTSALLRAYEDAGLPVPPLTDGEVPFQAQVQPQPRQPTKAEAEAQAEAEAEAEWQTMLNHTRRVLRMTGMGDPAIDALLATLDSERDRARSGQPSPRDQHIAEEMAQKMAQERTEPTAQPHATRRTPDDAPHTTPTHRPR